MSVVNSAALRGVTATPVRVEVRLTGQSSAGGFTISGLFEAAARESVIRVRSAIQSAGFRLPSRRISVEVLPTDMPKNAPSLDLPIAIGILLEAGAITPDYRTEYLMAGELSLNSPLRPIRGALPLALAAREAGLTGVILPRDVAAEATSVEGLTVRAASSLREVVDFFNGQGDLPVLQPTSADPALADDNIDLADVVGQGAVKRVLEIAAAGGHNLLMVGPPGSGKSMIARRLTTILPPMSREESLETTRVYSAVGLVPPGTSLIHRRPFRAPHHTISDAGLLGGGIGPHPGEVSLAHNGVLFLDELPEFRRMSLEVLRTPLSVGEVYHVRSDGTVALPARVQLVAAMHPCPCGYLRDRSLKCSCAPEDAARYRRRASPLRDLFDLSIDVPPLGQGGGDKGHAEPSAVVRARVEAARERQRARQGDALNARLGAVEIRRTLDALGEEARQTLEQVIRDQALSAHNLVQVLRVARTVADLAGSEGIAPDHVAEAARLIPARDA